jgi:hypothetical protein
LICGLKVKSLLSLTKKVYECGLQNVVRWLEAGTEQKNDDRMLSVGAKDDGVSLIAHD